ncbi:MAG: hypothetical protein M3Q34_02065 [bacterium]|nr:hypothetical protein [bacterium]
MKNEPEILITSQENGQIMIQSDQPFFAENKTTKERAFSDQGNFFPFPNSDTDPEFVEIKIQSGQEVKVTLRQ